MACEEFLVGLVGSLFLIHNTTERERERKRGGGGRSNRELNFCLLLWP